MESLAVVLGGLAMGALGVLAAAAILVLGLGYYGIFRDIYRNLKSGKEWDAPW